MPTTPTTIKMGNPDLFGSHRDVIGHYPDEVAMEIDPVWDELGPTINLYWNMDRELYEPSANMLTIIIFRSSDTSAKDDYLKPQTRMRWAGLWSGS